MLCPVKRKEVERCINMLTILHAKQCIIHVMMMMMYIHHQPPQLHLPRSCACACLCISVVRCPFVGNFQSLLIAGPACFSFPLWFAIYEVQLLNLVCDWQGRLSWHDQHQHSGLKMNLTILFYTLCPAAHQPESTEPWKRGQEWKKQQE